MADTPEDPKKGEFWQTIRGFTFTMAGLQTALNRNSEGEVEVGTHTQRLVLALKGMGGFVKKQAQTFEAVEKGGALYRHAFEKQIESSKKLSREIGFGANVYDGYNMKLTANRLGLDMNSAAVKDLMRVSMVTGEQFGALAKPLMAFTMGNLRQTRFVDKLIRATNAAASGYNRSTTEIINAISKLTQNTRDLINLGKIDEKFGVQLAHLRGITDLEATSQRQTKFLQQLVSDPSLGAALGVTELTNQVIQGTAGEMGVMRLLLAAQKGAEKFMMRNAEGTAAGNMIMGTMEEQFKAMTAVALGNQLQTDMTNKLQKAGMNVSQMTQDQQLAALVKIGQETIESNKAWVDTLDVIKREFAVPLIEQTVKFGRIMKNVLEGVGGVTIQKALQGILFAFTGLVGVIAEIGTWFTLGKTDTALMAIRDGAFAFQSSMEQEFAKANKAADETAQNTKKPPEPVKNLFKKMESGIGIEIRQRKMIIKSLDGLLRAQERGNELTRGLRFETTAADTLERAVTPLGIGG